MRHRKKCTYITAPRGRSDAYGGAVMRCQGKKLTPGQAGVIRAIARHHDHVVIFIGFTGGFGNEADPLPWQPRGARIRAQFPNIEFIFVPIEDHAVDSLYWSEDLDTAIARVVPRSRGIILYDGRDGFSQKYSGEHPVVLLKRIPGPSGTRSRARCRILETEEACETLIAYHQERLGVGYSNVNTVVIDYERNALVMIGKRKLAHHVAFIEGPWQKTDKKMQSAARRIQREQVKGMRLSMPVQICTMPIADPRTRRSVKDGYVNTICVCRSFSGKPRPVGIAESAVLVRREDLLKIVVPHHRPIARYVLKNWDEIRRRLIA